jgi:hypothetical protein
MGGFIDAHPHALAGIGQCRDFAGDEVVRLRLLVLRDSILEIED